MSGLTLKMNYCPSVKWYHLKESFWAVTCSFSFTFQPPQMSALCRRLDELWEENQGCVILFTWIQFLKEEALDFLGIQSPLEVIRAGSKAGAERRKADHAATGIVCVRFI